MVVGIFSSFPKFAKIGKATGFYGIMLLFSNPYIVMGCIFGPTAIRCPEAAL